MIVSDYLPQLKASKYTYYNLDKSLKEEFRQKYNYLKKNTHTEVNSFVIWELNKILNNSKYLDFERKIKAINLISTNLKLTKMANLKLARLRNELIKDNRK